VWIRSKFDGSDQGSFGSEGKDFGQFMWPARLFARDSELFVMDRTLQRIQVFDSTLRKIVRQHNLKAAKLLNPRSFVVDGDEIFVSDSKRGICKFRVSGESMECIECSAQLYDPVHLALSLPHRRIYASYAKGERIGVFE
jgi:hypothetical protein